MTTVTLGWEGTKAEIPLYQNSDLVFSLDPIDATSGNITSWPVGAASTLYFFEGDPVRNATTPIISIPGVVEPPSIDYVVQQETLAPSSGGPPTSCSRCRCPKPHPGISPLLRESSPPCLSGPTTTAPDIGSTITGGNTSTSPPNKPSTSTSTTT
ncbi:hypothetical protein SAMN04488548_13821 [Gordonia westfalica]|uniref:LtfC/p132/Gp6 beta-sandwich domain-containing protein n=1 Tax=Gordonia westfalica TaxID=158898 RepID=A0A1H2M354_9ACTN|nr:hypothetical protein SAMN04488548_13821 [Gordonia westfalica]